MLSIFLCVHYHLHVLFGKKYIFRSSAHFLIEFSIFWYWSIWTIYNSLYVISFTNIFSNSIVIELSFHFVMGSFAVQNLCLIRPYFLFLLFISFALGNRSETYFQDLCQRVFLCFLLEALWFLFLHVRLLIHLKFIL